MRYNSMQMLKEEQGIWASYLFPVKETADVIKSLDVDFVALFNIG